MALKVGVLRTEWVKLKYYSLVLRHFQRRCDYVIKCFSHLGVSPFMCVLCNVLNNDIWDIEIEHVVSYENNFDEFNFW